MSGAAGTSQPPARTGCYAALVPSAVMPAAAETSLLMEHLKASRSEAQAALEAPLSDGWVVCRAPGGEVYYHCSATGASQWAHPSKPWAGQRAPCMDVKALRNALRPVATKDASEAAPAAETTTTKQHSVYDARSRHTKLPTPPTLFSDAGVSVVREDLQARAFALHGLLSVDEASSYATSAAGTGFLASDVAREFPAEVRNNSRLVHFSDALAAALWRRLAPCLAHKDIYLIQPMGFGAEGRWKPIGVNPCFRVSRYVEGEHFATHRDGMYANENGECSIYSLVLYLNEDFEGGDLELPNGKRFKPVRGSAVLFPHDMLHEGRAVCGGTKYVVRSELMFRCVDAQPPPSTPSFASDPLFQRMAALYEQIGDIAMAGNAKKTTDAYQEALGIQVAYQGTDARGLSSSQLPLVDTLLAGALSFLSPAEVVSSVCSRRWRESSKLGVLWRELFRRRWPRSSQVQEDMLQSLDPELTDWSGEFKRIHAMERPSGVCILFISSNVAGRVQGRDPFKPVLAMVHHQATGIGWDASFKHRLGWNVGSLLARKSWLSEGNIDWEVVPELFACAFRKIGVQPSEHRVLIPALPGVWEGAARARMARILSARFRVPKVHIPPAPLCALLSHNISTGVVVWVSSLGESGVFCYRDAKEVARLGPFDFKFGSPDAVAALLQRAANIFGGDLASGVLQHVVLSYHKALEASGDTDVRLTGGGRSVAGATDSDGKQPKAWFTIDAIKKSLSAAAAERKGGSDCVCSFRSSKFYGPLEDDVLVGADALANSPGLLGAHEVTPEETGTWEWRLLANGKCLRLPEYVCGVLEGALRCGERYAAVMFGASKMIGAVREIVYLFADLEEFTLAAAQADRPNFLRRRQYIDPEEYDLLGPRCCLTRFLRGRPSSVPDRRKPEELDLFVESIAQIEAVADPEALHVLTAVGQVVFSASKAEAINFTVREVLEDVGISMGKPQEQLTLISGGCVLDRADSLRPLLETEGPVELLVVVGEKRDEPNNPERLMEWIPEDCPGSTLDLMELSAALTSAALPSRFRRR